ncbi:hypothetical protein AtDm6_2175 [Acetobacter tropicalis]|uniref:Uncharacterized protein n=1 Tax=Acetobacter tropicalis TaxID=104102 RepID=A0A094YPQ6_9PROT|nr:hypothetical protein AtDm6_2175 [Acetobacter tropicalis]
MLRMRRFLTELKSFSGCTVCPHCVGPVSGERMVRVGQSR